MSLTFISCPYTSTNPAETEFRIKALCYADAWLIKRGVHTVTPLSKLLVLQHVPELDTSYDFWRNYCRKLMAVCSNVVLLPLNGWETSVGVQDELSLARELGLPITEFEKQILLMLVGRLGV